MVGYKRGTMKIRKVNVYVTEVVADSIQFLEPKTQMTLNKIYTNNKYNKHVDNRNIQITNQ